jgi:hypothetical protein
METQGADICNVIPRSMLEWNALISPRQRSKPCLLHLHCYINMILSLSNACPGLLVKWLTCLTYNLRRVSPGQATYKEGLSDEIKNCGPLYQSVYARASKISHTVRTVACSGLYTSSSVLQLLKCWLGGMTSLRAPPANVPQARPERGVWGPSPQKIWIQNRLDVFSWHLGSCNTTSERDEICTRFPRRASMKLCCSHVAATGN